MHFMVLTDWLCIVVDAIPWHGAFLSRTLKPQIPGLAEANFKVPATRRSTRDGLGKLTPPMQILSRLRKMSQEVRPQIGCSKNAAMAARAQ